MKLASRAPGVSANSPPSEEVNLFGRFNDEKADRVDHLGRFQVLDF